MTGSGAPAPRKLMQLDPADNYFELFGIPLGFKVEPERIESKYRELQSLLHPDRYATAGAREKRLALQGAALVNQAYAVLNDDCERAAYLLELEGIEFNDEPDTLDEPDFLMEQMELRETLEQAVAAAVPDDALEQLEKDVVSRMSGLSDRFRHAYASGDFPAARGWVLKMKFIRKLHAEIRGERRRAVRPPGIAPTGE